MQSPVLVVGSRKAAEEEEDEEAWQYLEIAFRKETSKGNKHAGNAEPQKTTLPPQEPTSTTDPAKKLRNLRKKLRDIEALEAKLNSGEVKKPEPEQLEKVARKPQVEEEIRALERVVS